MKALAGTGRLLRFSLRLDRVRLPVWIVANVGLVAITLPQLIATYNTEPKRLIYATTSSSSAVTRLLNSALAGPSMGDIAVVEVFLTCTLLIALMNIFIMTRHTRQEEETGRYEVIGSMQTGRQASLTAAFIETGLATLVTAALIFAVFLANGFAVDGSLAFSAAVGGVGLIFAGVAAVTAQLFESTRSANGVAGLAFGLAFAVRGVGDVLGKLKPGGLGVVPSSLTWFSPLGWVTTIQPFSGIRWWVLGMFGAMTVGFVAAAYILLSRRDIGGAFFAPRLGKASASPLLLRPFGLIWRLNRTATISWGLALVAAGATVGAVAHEFTQLVAENPDMQKILAELGGNKSITDILFSVMFIMIGIAVAGYALQVSTRIRTEELSGRLELLLSTSRSRTRWLMGYVIYIILTSAVILVATGFTAAFVNGLISGDLWTNIHSLSLNLLIYLPAVMLLVSTALLTFGKLPRAFVAFAWSLLAACFLLFQLGAVLKLPQYVLDLSPFTHGTAVPISDITFKPLIVQSIIALVFGIASFIFFNRRDIASS